MSAIAAFAFIAAALLALTAPSTTVGVLGVWLLFLVGVSAELYRLGMENAEDSEELAPEESFDV